MSDPYAVVGEYVNTLAQTPFALVWAIVFAAWIKAFRPTGVISVALRLAGTFLHEASHWLVALVLLGRPIGFSIIPVRQADGSLQLGAVRVGNLRWWNAVFIGCAPLALGGIGVWLVSLGESGWASDRNIGLGFAASQCFLACWPSREDLRHAGPSALAYGLIGVATWLLVGQ